MRVFARYGRYAPLLREKTCNAAVISCNYANLCTRVLAMTTPKQTNPRQSLDPGFSLGFNEGEWHVVQEYTNYIMPSEGEGGEYAVC